MAERNGHRVPPECEFSDEAISGTKLRREGLDAMLAAASEGTFQVLYFHSLSRLARESVITMPMLKMLVYTRKIRIISVTEGIDSDRDGWDVIASVMSLLHERYIKELSANVFRGQEGTVLARFCVGDYRFGYKSVPVPGTEATRKGRNAKPRMTYAIDEQTSPWVMRIFYWFVQERRSLRWITRELNRSNAPKDHRATTKHWHHTQVAELLACEKYIGIWRWGENKNCRDPLTGRVHQERRPEEDCENWVRQFPELRLIEGETFAIAQTLLQQNYELWAAHRQDDGSIKGSGKGGSHASPRHLLSGLIRCGACGAIFHVGGTNGSYLQCPGYLKGVCGCQTRLLRERAERLILDAVGQRILADAAWFGVVFDGLLHASRERNKEIPAELAAVEKALDDVDRRLTRLVDQVENGVDDPSIRDRLAERREERRALAKRREVLRSSHTQPQHEPTEDWLREELQHLSETLRNSSPAAALALRELVGGAIIVTEIRRAGRKRFFLQGRFTIRSNSVVNLVDGYDGACPRTSPASDDAKSQEFVIDFVEPRSRDEEAERFKDLYDQGLTNMQIAQQMGCARSWITKLCKHWFGSRGLTAPDGRARRAQLDKANQTTPTRKVAPEEAKELFDQGLLMREIAKRLDCDANTVTRAIASWYASRGLEVPDGRCRRKTLGHTVERPIPPQDSSASPDSSSTPTA